MHFGVRGAFGTPGQRRWAWSQKRARGIEFFCEPGAAFGTLWRPLGRFGRPFRRLWATLGLHSGVLVLHFGVPGTILS